MNPIKFISIAAMFAMSPGFAFAGSAQVKLGEESFSLNEVTCEGSPESFSVQASVNQGAELLQLAAFKGEVQTVGFRVGDTLAQVADSTGTYDGSTFKFQGEAQVYTLNSINRRFLDITVSC